jgi:branched-chain amino acid transport system ATP-binding protein
MISLDTVTVSFGGLIAVDAVTTAFEAGQISGLIGPNGAGKTTLFNSIAGHVPAASGRVLLDGKDITRLKPHERAALGLARTFQIPQEFGRLTVLENLMAAASSPDGENLFNVILNRRRYHGEQERNLEAAQATASFLELGSMALEKAGNLSGGQKKLLELGRALMCNPRIILLDEIGAGINRTLLSKIAEKIKDLNRERGLTFVLIEHDLEFVARLCSRVVVMAQGSVLTEGTVAEVRRDERVIEAYFGGGRYEATA